MDTTITPDYKSAVSQIVQTPGVSGMENNSILFGYNSEHEEDIGDIVESCRSAAFVGFNVCVLRTSDRHFGYHRCIHIWLTEGDLRNAALMIILAYIIAGHKDWKQCEIKLFAAFHHSEAEEQIRKLNQLVLEGRLPIAAYDVQQVPQSEEEPIDQLVPKHSEMADLVVAGLSLKKLIRDKGRFLKYFSGNQDVLLVRAGQDILIAPGTVPEPAAPADIEAPATTGNDAAETPASVSPSSE